MRRSMAASALALLLALALPAGSEIYRWTDAAGQQHFTQDLGQVPAAHRAAAEASARAPKGHDRIQVYSSPASPARASARAARLRRTSLTARPGQTYTIPVQRAGTSLVVSVRLNDLVNARFLIDTGASDVVIPSSVAAELGLDGDGGRTKVYSTANGLVTQRAVVLDSVALGEARVSNVAASISDSMSIGLLGLSYFNHFNYSVDPARGIVTLVRNGLIEQGLIRGGRSEAQWRSEYANLRSRIEAVAREKRSKSAAKTRTRERLDQAIAELERQRTVLDDEADSAKVPFSWRD